MTAAFVLVLYVMLPGGEIQSQLVDRNLKLGQCLELALAGVTIYDQTTGHPAEVTSWLACNVECDAGSGPCDAPAAPPAAAGRPPVQTRPAGEGDGR
jgi:hypothetical protein